MTTGPGPERSSEHDELHVLLGAFVLGGLHTEEHQAFSRHLRRCAICQRDAAQLSGLPAMLDLVEPEDAASAADDAATEGRSASVVVPPRLLDRVRADRLRRRWRVAAAAAVLAVLAAGIGASVGPVMSRVNAPPTRPLVASAARATGAGPAPQVEIDLVTRTWGTQLDLRGSSLPADQVLFLSVTDRDGHAYDVASWTGTPTGRATLSAACWMKTSDIAQVQVHTRGGEAIATASS